MVLPTNHNLARGLAMTNKQPHLLGLHLLPLSCLVQPMLNLKSASVVN